MSVECRLNGLGGFAVGPMVVSQQNHSSNRDMFQGSALNVMSYWEQNWRRNLKLITVDEVPPAQQIQVSRWLKQRTELLLGQIQAVDAESLAQEFDDYEDACC